MKRYIKSQQQNLIKVDTSYTVTNQGLSIVFVIEISCDQVINITKTSQMFLQFIFDNFKKFFEKNAFRSKYQTPMIIGSGQKLNLYMCFVSKYTKQLQEQVEKLGIQERKYV